jgi:hypothetical protein
VRNVTYVVHTGSVVRGALAHIRANVHAPKRRPGTANRSSYEPLPLAAPGAPFGDTARQ